MRFLFNPHCGPRVFRILGVYGERTEKITEMFSPTHTLPPESDSDEEEDLDLPVVDVGTPKKLKRESESEQTQPPTKTTSTSASSRSHCLTSSSTEPSKSSASFRSPSPSNLPAAHHDMQRLQFKETQDAFRLMKDNLKYLSPVKLEIHRASVNESKRTASKVRKLSKNLMEKTDRERKVSSYTLNEL